MARGGGGASTQGWGEYLRYSFPSSSFTVTNAAIAGRSARSYTREGRFAAVAAAAGPGDWVVIEFGHNDGGGLGGSSGDNGRTDCFGDGSQTCESVYDGQHDTVQTFPTYVKNATAMFLRTGAKVIISSATPNNVWESGSFAWAPSRFDYYAWLAAAQSGGPGAGVYYVPHGAYAAQAMRNMGEAAVDAGYPKDHTHTSPALADVMARSFVLGLRCGTSELGAAVVNSTESLTSGFLGACIQANSSMPI
ncbi:GDSL-like Lipase/Acylhydrolase [Pleurostoma richardsiae]|uniref:GDSL-like Lipase/Acylhydrolase n=1 Tax=Pleurostoma richardsiae TaxID=41990 RepID=A0AA38RV35_9PEZI|nr:GDSL-like Lipase/Acylhydrolase [Pleurostoma richardsiae]